MSFDEIKRDDKLHLTFYSECVMRFDPSYPTKNVLGVEPPCEFTDLEGVQYEIPNLKISVTLKNKERLIFFTSATDLFHALHLSMLGHTLKTNENEK